MDSLELQLRGYTRSWFAWVGSALVSAVLFVGVAFTSITPKKLERPDLPPLVLASAPASPLPGDMPSNPRPSGSPDLAQAFKFDPTTAVKPPEIPIGRLDVSAFGGSLKFFDADAGMGVDLSGNNSANLAMSLGMGRTFEVQKPGYADRFVIFEREQVDEIPEWLYGPQPRIPRQQEHTDWNVLVLYSVSEKGRAENIFVLDATSPECATAVKEAVANWNFRPARKGGKAVRVWVQQPVHYEPSRKSPFEI